MFYQISFETKIFISKIDKPYTYTWLWMFVIKFIKNLNVWQNLHPTHPHFTLTYFDYFLKYIGKFENLYFRSTEFVVQIFVPNLDVIWRLEINVIRYMYGKSLHSLWMTLYSQPNAIFKIIEWLFRTRLDNFYWYCW